jgi:hypothetical protein
MIDPRNSTFFRKGLFPASVALGLGLFAGSVPASALPLSGAGLSSPGLVTEPAAYRHLKNRQLYVADSYGSPSYPSYPRSSQGMPFGGSDEVLELQRLFPSTLWPRSMRYFPYP